MKLNELKSELKEKEKGCGKTKWEEGRKRICGIGHGINLFYCPTCQAKIEIYKKGISACEEKDKDIVENILNRIDTCVISPFEGVSLDKDITRGKTMDLMREQFNKTCNQIREEILNQSLSQRNKEIRANIDKLLDVNLPAGGASKKNVVLIDGKKDKTADTQTLINKKYPYFYHIGDEIIDSWLDKANERIKQALNQRNQEEIEFLDELQNKTKDIDVMMFCKLRMIKLKQQLTTNSEVSNG